MKDSSPKQKRPKQPAENRRLRQENRRLEQENERLRQQNNQLQEQVEQLQRELARPAAPFRRSETQKIGASEHKRPGRPVGHKGAYRPVPDRVDEEVDLPLSGCPHCGEPVADLQATEQYIEEIPPLRPRVTKLRTYRAHCPRCGPVSSTHPLQTSTAAGAAGVQLGPRALALAALLNKSYGLTLRKTCRVLEALVGLQLSPGGLSQALDRVADRVQPQYEQLARDLRQSKAVFVDETSWWVGGPGWWLWTFTDPQTTRFQVEPSRAGQVVRETLAVEFSGVLVSDCLGIYDSLPYRQHKCIAHHLKAIAQARDRPDTRDPTYLEQWTLFFRTVTALYPQVRDQGTQSLAAPIAHLQAWRDRLLNQAVGQPGDLTIQNRLRKQQARLLTCLEDPAAEPTNNRAERALRPAVIARKLSCGNKTSRGKRTWEILASLAATCHQRGTDFPQYLAAHLPLSAQAR